MAKVSVVVATYARPDYLRRCLTSLLSQLEKPDEIVVVTTSGDLSCKALVEFFQSECEIHGIAFKEMTVMLPGIVSAENAGLRSISGDIVCFIDDDAIADSNWINLLKRHYHDSDVGAVGGPVVPCVDGKPILRTQRYVGKIAFFGFVIDDHNRLTQGMSYVDHLAGSNMSFRRELFNQFDERLIGRHFRFEMDCCLSIKKSGCKIVYDPEIRVYHYSARAVKRGYQNYSKKSYTTVYSATEIFSINCNNTYVLLKHLSFPSKLLFLLFTFIVGDASSYGFLVTFIRLAKYKNIKVLCELLTALRGKLKGISLYVEREVKG